MQGYQIRTTITRDDCCLIALHVIASSISALAVVSLGDFVMPTSPGHANIPNDYPPNRRRRR